MSTTIETWAIRSPDIGPHVLQTRRDPDPAEELANSVTHGAGMALSIAGLYTLVRIACTSGPSQHALGCVVYGVSLVLVYTASTCYHACRHPRRKQLLLLLDHIGIYLLIAGTYTPLALNPLNGRSGWGLLLLVWALVLAGSLAKVRRFERISDDPPWSYLALSWVVFLIASRLVVNAAPAVFPWLLAGGIFYTLGVGFFIQRGRRYSHAVWHLLVLAGSVCHYRAMIVLLPLLS